MATLMQLVKKGDNRAIKKKLEVIRSHSYAKGFMAGLIHFLRPGDICVDCGANVGLFSKEFAQTGATVIAFEPDSVARKELEANTSGMKNLTIVPAAVGAENGEITLYRERGFEDDPVAKTVGSTIVQNMNGRNYEQGEKVKLVALHEELEKLIKTHGKIRLLKLDIEGSEVEVINELLARNLFDKIDVTLVETHESQRPSAIEDYQKFRKLAAENPQWGLFLDWV